MSNDKIWECYPATLRSIATLLDELNCNSYEEYEEDDLKFWITEDSNAHGEGAIIAVAPEQRDSINEGYGFGWILPSEFSDGYGVCLFERCYTDFTTDADQIRILADMIDQLDKVEEAAFTASNKAGMYQGIGLSSKITVIRGGDEEDILGTIVDTVGGAYTFKGHQP